MAETPQKISPGWDTAVAEKIIQDRKDLEGAMLPILNALQKEFGFIAPEAVPVIADALNLSRAEVYGVISFYHDYRQSPPGKHIVKICRAEACQSMGARDLEVHAKQKLGIDLHETTDSGDFTLMDTYCLGNCACAPAVMIDEELHARVTPKKFDEMIEKKRAV